MQLGRQTEKRADTETFARSHCKKRDMTTEECTREREREREREHGRDLERERSDERGRSDERQRERDIQRLQEGSALAPAGSKCYSTQIH